ncbi:MAG: hypothetical protein QNK04_22005 [Myxococcota bacterium]|nr:hypothetical protein [Myxococcota bacterium]
MKRQIEPKPDAELRRTHPIHDRLEGWFFRVTETSAGAYLAEGSDRYGRLVSRIGDDPEELLEECVADARAIERQVG